MAVSSPAAPPAAHTVPSCASSAACPAATALPSGGHVQAGTAIITQAGDTIMVRQTSEDVSISWQSFNIGAQDTVDFLQPSSSALAINRIASVNGSQILGHLDANGQVWLINPNGVLFGRGAEVNVGGLVASTLAVTDPGFSGATFNFSGAGAGSIVNQGTITAASGGYVALLGKAVSNQGTISARLGTVALGAGSATTLSFAGTGLVKMQVDQSTLNTLAANGGLIQADGGTVIMSAGAKDALLASVVNNTGVIEARTVENHGGTIELLGGMTAGTVKVGGTLDASAPAGGNGGFIETDAAHVEVGSDARVTTLANSGKTGNWLIDPTDFTVAPSGGDATGATLSADLNTTNTTILSSTGSSPVTGGGSGGNININDTVSWTANTTLTVTAANNVNVNANMTATGNTAGLVINPNTANGSEAASGSGVFSLAMGDSITLSGSNPSLSIAGTAYTVINSLGAPGSTTGTDLQGINGNLSGDYALGSNINAAATASWNGGAGFTPIGNPNNTAYNGIFNGLGHSINNLTINLPSNVSLPSNDYVGLFGYTGGGSVIQNVGLVGGSVSGEYDVGDLVGLHDGAVSNSYATGKVGGYANVGGLVGVNQGTVGNSYATGSVSGGTYSGSFGGLVGANDGAISSSYATGSVSGGGGSGYFGGLAGFNGGQISSSYATGSVSGFAEVGGLVGYSYYGTVSNSYATGNVTGSSYVGGLVGYDDEGSTASNSYATGSVSGVNFVGGLVGYNYFGSVSNSFWDTTTSGQSSSAGGSPLSDPQMQSAASFTGWSISGSGGSGDVWRIYQGNTYPLLLSFLTPLTLSNTTVTYNGSAQSGASIGAPNSGVFGTAANGTNAGAYTGGYYSNQQGYDITGGNLIINPAALTLSGTRVYDGTTVVAGSVLTATGVAGQTFVVTGAGDPSNLSSKDVQTGSTLSSVTGLVLGTSSNGGLASNYTALSTGGSSFTITPLALSGASIASAGSVYGSTVTPGAVTLNGVLAGDTGLVTGTATIASPAYSTSNHVQAGSYTQTATLSGADALDYTFAGGASSYTTPTANYTVSPLALSATSIASVSSIYGTPKPAGAVTLSGVITGDTVSATASVVTPPNSTSGSGNLDAGSYSQTASMLSGADAGNYTLAGGYTTPTANYTVSPLALKGATIAAVSSTYGTPKAAGAVTLTGVITGDKVGSTASIVKPVDSSSGNLDAGSYAQTASALSGADARNYTFAGGSFTTPTANYTVGRLTLDVTGVTATNKVYNGSAADPLGGKAAIAPLKGDKVTLSGTGVGAFASANVGKGEAVTVSGYSLSGADAGNYALWEPTGLSATITQLSSVAWVGGSSGLWSKASNWAGGAIPDYGNVASVSIPSGATVTYDSGVPGATTLSTLTSSGTLVLAAGKLSTSGSLSTAGYEQSGGTLDVGGSLTIRSTSGGVSLGDITAGALSVSSKAGAITQLASSAIDVTGASSLTADNGLAGTCAVAYNVTLAQAADSFGGAVSATGLNIDLLDGGSGGLILGNTSASGSLSATARAGALTQAASTAIDVTGITTLAADNGVSGKGAVDYAVTLAQSTDKLQGAVSAQGSAITLDDATALTATLDSTGAVALDAAGALVVGGTVGTSLTTVTTGGAHSTTTFDATSVGSSLKVTSTGGVTTATTSTVLTVDGAGTKTPNSHVTVNGVTGAEIK